ncbi:MAG: type I methionyl aminopeptidase [Mucinivorans sp.]
MIKLKNREEIELMRISNLLVGKTLALVGEHIKEGVTTLELDRLAEEFIRDNGAVPAFKGYGGFPASLCTSINEVVVHGIPSAKQVLRNGDVVSIDCGTFINGFVGDSAYTFAVGEIAEATASLLRVTKEALYKGIATAQVGKRIGDVSYAVQQHCEKAGYSVVREMVGHGCGRVMHEDPQVPNYGRPGSGPKIVEGMVICIEPMINLGARNVVFEEDGWTCRTKDRKPAAHFEHCIAIVDGKADILSSFSFIEG